MLIRLRSRLDWRDDSGFGLIMVIAMAGIVTALMVVSTTMATRALSSSTDHDRFEGAMAAAENGVDQILARAQKVYNIAGADAYVIPSNGSVPGDPTPACNQAPVAWPFTSQPTSDQERQWARGQLQSLATVSGCLQTTAQGDFVVLKPSGHQAIYAMGWSPHYGVGRAASRLLKAEYLFKPYAPSNAILTSGPLALDASTLVKQAGSNCPATAGATDLAAIHSNGTITVSSGNPTVCGTVSSSQASTSTSSKFVANSGGAVQTTAKQSVPVVSAAEVWGRNHNTAYQDGWYDLCSDGTVRQPNGSAPCQGTILGDYSSSGSNAGTAFRGGWTYNGTYSPPRWLVGPNIQSGVYYVNGADVYPASGAGNTYIPNATIIAAASQTSCNKIGGNIVWDHNNISAPEIPNLFMLADQDLMTTSNFAAGSMSGSTVVSGFFIAGDQVNLQTSSNGAYGAVVAADQCDPPNGQSPVDYDEVKNPALYYDPNAQAPFVDVINTTLWLEMVGN